MSKKSEQHSADQRGVKMTPIASAVALLFMGMSIGAHAQEAAVKASSEPIQEVQVTGIRASLQKSMSQKKNNQALVEVITAEDIGKMPDKNVADSLSRIPGVTTTSAGSAEGSFGENEHVQMRGLPAQLTLTTLNGHGVSTGDWYGPNISNGGRSVTYTLLPSDLVGRIVVHKTSQADLIEGGAAGTVDIETRKPLDFKEHFSGAASIEAARSTAAKSTDPAISALVSWKNADSTFGILAQVFSQTRKLQRAGSEGVWWDTMSTDTTPGTATGDNPALSGKAVSLLSGAVLFSQTRKREGAYLEAQWKPSAGMMLDVSAFHSTVNAQNYNTNYMAYTIAGRDGNVTPTSYTVSGNTLTSLFYGKNVFGADTAGKYSVVEDVAARPDAKTDSKFVNIDGKWTVSDRLTLTSKLGSTSGGGSTKDVGFEVQSGWNQGAGYSLTPEGIFVLNVPGGDKFVKAGGGIGGWGGYTSATDKESYGQIDGQLRLSSEMAPMLKFGVRAANHRHELTKIGMTLGAGANDDTQIPDSAIGNYAAGWAAGLPSNPTPGFLPFKISDSYVASWVDKYATFTEHAVQQEFNIKESTTAAYLMADLNPSDKISGNTGVRVVRTHTNIAAYLPGGVPNYEQTFTNILPSLNLRADFGSGLIGRFALNRGLSRPDFGQMAGNELDDLASRGVGSNPYLKPIRSNNLDSALEWYFSPKSMVSVGLFASKLQGTLAYTSEELMYANSSKGGKITPYDVSLPVNTDGIIRGFEFAYEQALGAGFGISTNYTFANGSQSVKLDKGTCNGTATQDCSLYGTSKDAYNLGAFYENDSFSARVGWTYRTTYKLGNRGGRDYFQSGNGSLNLAVNYNISKNVQLTFEAQNINDPLLTVYQTDQTQISGVYKNGREIYAGLRLKF